MAQGVYTGKDRRASVRFRFNAAVDVTAEGRSFEAKGTDFNDDAISIVHSEALPVGTAVVLSAIDEMGNHVTFYGEVARSGEADGEGLFTMVIRRVDHQHGG